MAWLVFQFLSLAASPSTLHSFEDQIEKGTEALHQHDALLAKQHFVAAKKAGKGEQKKLARRLIRKMRYLEDYCTFVKKGGHFIQDQQYRLAYQSFQKAQSILETSIRKHPVPDLDSELSYQIKTRVQQTNRERKTAFQDAIQKGQQLLIQDDPHAALAAFKYAKDQMYQNEYNAFDIQYYLSDAKRKADYKDFLIKGNEYLADGDLHNARNWFYKAQGKWETSEVANNIEEVEVLLLEAYISEGESYFTVGAYEKALLSFQKAYDYRETNEVVHWIDKTKEALYNQFLEEGDTFSVSHSYPEAIVAYQKAQSYWDSEEIKQRILRAKEDHYQYLVQNGKEALQQDALEKALEQFKKAAEVKSTEQIKSLIIETEDKLYLKHFNIAQDSLEREVFAGALAAAQIAQTYKTTPEIQTLIQQAENGMEYEELFNQGLNLLQDQQPDEAYQRFTQAKSYWVTKEVEYQIKTLETLFVNFEEFKQAGDQALLRGELESAIAQYKKAQEVCLREGITGKIQELETRLVTYKDYLQKGKTAYNQDQATQALQHFEHAAQYQQTPETEVWIDRAKRMPCTIAVNLHGNAEKFKNTRLEIVDYYTLDILYKANPTGNSFIFPKVPGGGDSKYYLRAFLVENDQNKTPIKEVACDCSTDRRHEVSIAVE